MDPFALYVPIAILIIGFEIYKSPSFSAKTKTTLCMVMLCVLPMTCMFLTFHQCYTLSFAQNRFVEWCKTPWISFMGVYEPTVFAVGLTAVAAMMLLINTLFIQGVLLNSPCLLQHSKQYSASTNEWMDWMLRNNVEISAILIIITGWINVEHSTVVEFLSVDIQSMNLFTIGWKADVHVSSVLAFFALLQAHNVIVVLRFNLGLNQYMVYSYFYKIAVMVVIFWGWAALAVSLLYVIFIADTSTQKGMQRFYDGHNTVGVSQYVVIFGYGFFWVSYAIDYLILQYALRKKSK